MTNKQSLRQLVDNFFRCVVCECPTRVGAKRICEGCLEMERTEVARQEEVMEISI